MLYSKGECTITLQCNGKLMETQYISIINMYMKD